MQDYGVADVEKLLHLPRSTIRALVGAGFVTPARGPRNAWRFSFQDLIVLRTARALAASSIPQRRIARALRDLRARLPQAMPLSGLAIGALADQVVVREGSRRWEAASGQYMLAFEGDPGHGALHVLTPAADTPSAASGPIGIDLERDDADAALRGYDAQIASHPDLAGPRINRGRLLHELGRHADALATYVAAIDAGLRDALLSYNLGVLLDDLDRHDDARRAYEAALALDPALADAHYNLALLCEELDQPRDALRHMAEYRRLVGG